MKTGIVIVTRNAVQTGMWEKVLQAVQNQTLQPDVRMIIDSSSTDQTCDIARKFNWECTIIPPETFNHGLTRQQALLTLQKQGIDYAVFLSQDVILDDPHALQNLISFLKEKDITGCYGRQTGQQNNNYDTWQRAHCYPDHSCIKSLDDSKRLGLMTIFCSDAFSAWKISPVLALGGFPETSFGEDSLLAAKILLSGQKIGYCAEAVCFHEHSTNPGSLFHRGKMVGIFHRQNQDLLKKFKIRRSGFSSGRLSPVIFFQLLIKTAGYLLGRFGEQYFPWFIFCLIWLLLLPAIYLFNMPQRDLACRYAPMAEAFANGDWQFAFHPRIPPFLPVSAGILAYLLHCSGALACQLASSLMLSLSVFPLYHGCKRIYSTHIAAISTIFLVLCFESFRGGYAGLRETTTMFGVILLFYAGTWLKTSPISKNGYLWMIAGEFILLLTRGEIIIFAAVIFLLAFCWDYWQNKLPWRSLLSAMLLIFLLMPQLLYNYKMLGYPVLEVRHARIWVVLAKKSPAIKKIRHPAPLMPLYTE